MTKQEMVEILTKRIEKINSLREGDLDALNTLSKAFVALAELQDSIKHEEFSKAIMASQGLGEAFFLPLGEEEEEKGKVLSIVEDEEE